MYFNDEGHRIVNNLDIPERTEPFEPKPPFFSVKDHKPEYLSRPTIRLISPSKSDIGKISKKILDKIIPIVSQHSPLPLWINVTETLAVH